MKPIVENMGMDWKSQFTKLKQRFSSTVVEITIVAKDGKERLMTCLPVRKLAGWLYSISPNKVKPELREKVVMYQEECDDVLWRYWTNSQRTDAKQREALVAACDKLAIGNTLRSDVYTMVANHFGYEKVTQIPTPLLPEAVAFTYEMILARQKPVKTMSDNNEFWRYVGVIKYQELKQTLAHTRDVMDNLNKAIGSAQGHTGLIFDAFDGQHRQPGLGKEGHLNAYIRAQEYVEKQNKITARSL